MSTLGKVLVFLNLILAAAFLASSIFLLRQQETWRTKFEAEKVAHKSDVDTREKQIDDTKKDLDGQRSETARRAQEAEALRAENGQLKTQVTELVGYRDKTVKDIQSLATNFETLRKNNEDLQKQVDENRKSLDAMREERNAAKKAQEDAENKLAQSEEGSKQLDATKNSLMEQVKKMSDDLRRADNALAVYAERTGIPISEVAIAPPLISGNVVAADMGTKILQLNVGSDAGVKRGFGFAIYRGGEYKGEAVVEDVQAKFATARVVKLVSGKSVGVGDQATTRLF